MNASGNWVFEDNDNKIKLNDGQGLITRCLNKNLGFKTISNDELIYKSI